MLTTIRNRLRAILNPDNSYVSYPVGVRVTLADYAPGTQQDYEGFVIYIAPQQGSIARENNPQYVDTQQWRVSIRSRPMDIGDPNQVQNDLLDIADAVLQRFIDEPRLTTTSALANTRNVGIGNYSFSWQAYPSNTNLYRYTFAMSLTIQATRNRTC